VFALSSLVELALEADDLRHGHALERQENIVRLGIHTLDLALVVVIISYLDTEKVVECAGACACKNVCS
jgi:hypothetical protein